jgi:hypothetical protein
MTVTEIVQFAVHPRTDLKSDGAEGKETVAFICKTVSEQEGYEGMWHGLHVEDPGKLELLTGK